MVSSWCIHMVTKFPVQTLISEELARSDKTLPWGNQRGTINHSDTISANGRISLVGKRAAASFQRILIFNLHRS